LSTVSAAMVSYIFTGDSLPFECTLSPFNIANVPFYILLGFFCGLISLYFLRMTLHMEDRLSSLKKPFLKWFVCSLLLGGLILLFPPLYGEGYDFLHPLLTGGEISYDMSILSKLPSSPWIVPIFFLAVMLLKVFSMTFTNAGGGVGGTFGPTLFVGALAGFVLARTLNLIFANGNISVPEQNFVLVGMAGLMAGVMQAPMTAIFLIAEMTGGYELFLPLILTSTISFGTMRMFEQYSIYTKRIAASGELLTHDSDQAVLTLLRTTDLVEKDFSTIEIDATLGKFVQVIGESRRNLFPVIDSKGHFQGYVSLEDVRKDMFNAGLYEKRHVFNYMRSAPAYVYENENMESVMRKFESTDAWNLPVVKEDRTYLGFVSKSKIFSAYRNELKELSQD
ncbi:MAG: chloride channel protein, partial [Bacteroidales bacterium]|nr:chloride channel protein [Bacteroidales bacterium]